MSHDEMATYDFPAWDDHVDAAGVVGPDTAFHFRKLYLATVLLQRIPQARLLVASTNMDALM